ncbi:MAG: PH domain-containing protein [Chloroflexia bacterium]|nr:PH domain-containing protein [Chloroflexia bacterium]
MERRTILDSTAPHQNPPVTATDERLLPPKEHLDPRARTMWYVSESIQCAIWVVMVAVVAGVLLRFTEITPWWVWLAAGVIIVGNIAETAITPAWKYRYWRYEIREDEVDLQHGFVVKTRQLVPMTRIQHVDTRRSPLQQRFGLSSVVFFTAAGSMEIPALSQEIAADVRNRIAELAKVHDDL